MNGALSYNEKKLQSGQATILLASRFGTDISELSYKEKLRRFSLVNQRATRTKTNTVHLILSFLKEDNLNRENLQTIAIDYMKRIGFGNQPYIAYLHDDTGNPHLHIVSTPIQNNGRPINCHNIVQRLCHPAREAIENEYGITIAKGRSQSCMLAFNSNSLSNTVREIVSTYCFTNMEELNTVLQLHGFKASLGKIGSRQNLKGGIQYFKIDKDGHKIGPAVNASYIYTNPGMKNLQRVFAKNAAKSNTQAYLQQLQNTWLYTSRNSPHLRMDEFLEKKKISLHPQKGLTGQITHIILVDNNKRRIYTCHPTDLRDLIQMATLHKKSNLAPTNSDASTIGQTAIFLLQNLSHPIADQPDISPEFLKKKKRGRKL